MPVVYIDGNPQSEEERTQLLQEAFDKFMFRVPLEQRRYLRRFGYTETEIDEAIRNPFCLTWEFRPPR
jgi:hypothetical protein